MYFTDWFCVVQINIYVKWADVVFNANKGLQKTLEVDPMLKISELKKLAKAAMADAGAHDHMVLAFNGKRLADDLLALRDYDIVAESVIAILW